MTRVNFVEIVTLPLGPGGSLIPVPGVAVVPYTVNPDESQGPQAVAYAARTGATQVATLVTDAGGRVNYWVESGDYDIAYTDTHNPPRIASYTLGFSAAEALIGQIITTGDAKYSFQPNDHGQNPDGTYEWILVTSDADGGGRKLQQTLYMALWYILGSPAVDGNGNFRLPNVSGRTLVASGAATGLTIRHLNDSYGFESHSHTVAGLPIPSLSVPSLSIPSLGVAVAAHSHTLSANGGAMMWYDNGGNRLYSAGNAANGPNMTANEYVTFNNAPSGITILAQTIALTGTTDNSTPGGSTGASATGTGVTGTGSTGSGTSSTQTNAQPSYGMNLFVKT